MDLSSSVHFRIVFLLCLEGDQCGFEINHFYYGMGVNGFIQSLKSQHLQLKFILFIALLS
jgi:hypothetical protein